MVYAGFGAQVGLSDADDIERLLELFVEQLRLVDTGLDVLLHHTFRTLFPGVLRVCSRSALKHAWTGHREPLQSVSLGFFLTF